MGDDLYYIHGDLLGSTVLVTDQAGAPVGKVAYDPWGQVISNTVPLTLTDRLFTGQILDASKGLYYYNARCYDPYLNHFISPDTVLPQPAPQRALNRLTSCQN